MIRNFRPRIRTRHPSHSVLRSRHKKLPLFPFKSVIRLGSTTDMPDTVSNGGNRVELNIIKAIKNSANKLLMKTCFAENDVKTADWWTYCVTELDSGFVKEDGSTDNTFISIEELSYPIISKHIRGSRGTGNKKHDTQEDLQAWMEGKNLNNYIFEKFHNYAREYRLHVTKDGCFYSCRKMLKRDTPEEAKWYRNDDHCIWVTEFNTTKDDDGNIINYHEREENEQFDKPSNWEDIVNHSVKALNSVGLDSGAVDVKVKSSTNREGNIRENPEFIIIEINSAPSFGKNDNNEIVDTLVSKKYLEEIPKILMKKYNE